MDICTGTLNLNLRASTELLELEPHYGGGGGM